MVNKKIINFGISTITTNLEKSASYETKKWAELSSEASIMMYNVNPVTALPVDLPSKSLNMNDFLIHPKDDICDQCGYPFDKHELNPGFIKKMKRREKNEPIKIKDIKSLLIHQ